MGKLMILLVLFVSIILVSTIYFLNLSRITGMFIGFGEPEEEFKWWNVSWKYRIKLDINSSIYDRKDWPIEYKINFTDMLPSGTFDKNSTRVIEYSQSGLILYEVPSQFDEDTDFDASNNAIGTLVFLMNGTTSANTNRTFYIYYDTIENGAKKSKSYSTNLSYIWNGQKANITSSVLKLYMDTNRKENTSGLYRVEDNFGAVIIIASDNDRTSEYVEYYNNSHNLTFDLINNASFVNGSVRIMIEQIGDEIVFGNPNQKTNEGLITKKYYVYNRAGPEVYGSFIKIEQTIKNVGGYQIQRNSTPSGALAFDLNRTLNSGSIDTQDVDPENPYSWTWGSGIGGEMVGLLHLEQVGTSNYYALNNSYTPYGRIGIHLNNTTINSGSYLKQTSLIYFSGTGGSDAVSEFYDIRDRFENPITIYQSLPERWYIIIDPSTNETIYNRNETVLIRGNISAGDPYNLTEYMNATLDMGTASTTDDQIIILYDDGTHDDSTANDKVFTNSFKIPNDANLSVWTINFTTYTNNSEFLNSTTKNFNVTNILNVTVNITNKKPLINSIVKANIYVKNYRKDDWISGATINCSYDSSEVTNKTDHNNGTYSVNFTAPSQEGNYILSCNATKNGNFGNDTDMFTAEAGKTNISITIDPSNPIVSDVTLFNNDSFVIKTNATNIGNGTAYSSNISLELLNGGDANETLEECGSIDKNSYCIKYFNITVPNGTTPGNYYINVTVDWKNPDETTSSNKTNVNVTVDPNPKIDVEETKVSGETGDGIWTKLGNFTVFSMGNYQLTNITFNCVSGDVCQYFTVEFTPLNISSLPYNSKENVSINISIPLGYTPGTYNGTVNVSAQNNGFDTFILEATIPSKTNVSIVKSIPNYTAYNITQKDNETFELKSNATNIGNGSARFTNMSLILPSGWTSNSSLEYCNNLTRNSFCSKAFNVTIPNGTLSGIYLVNISFNWTNNDGSLGANKTYLEVTVAPNPLINVSEANVSGTVPDGVEETIGNFTVLSIGNDDIQNITFNCYSGDVCSFVIEFIPENISSLAVNSNQSVMINVTVPLGYDAGNHNGTVNVSAQNDKYKNLTLFVTVPSNRTWTMIPTSCDRSEYPDEGTVCEVLVKNLGNDIINFTISPEEGNYTKVNTTSFYVNGQSNYTFSVTYNVTGIEQAVYNSTFLVDVNQSDANPNNMTLNVTLYPYIPPMINFSISSNLIEQNDSVVILANVTDRSNSGIKTVNISVTKPDSSSNQTNMTLVNESGNFSQWNFTYPDNLGDTNLRGIYNVTVIAVDNIGNIGNLTKNFSVYKKILITSKTLSNTYLQGDTGSIYYVAKYVNNTGISDINVTFVIKNSNNNISYFLTEQTDTDGTIYPLPTFSIASDAPIGNYTLLSNSSFYDDILNKTIEIEKNRTFKVNARTITVTGLFADIETAVVWYPDNVMRFGILIYNGEGRPVDPTGMKLTVYDPAENLYFSVNMSSMTREDRGFYTYKYAMPSDSSVGMYLAVLNVSQDEFETTKLKAFRVSRGGPYDVRINLFENEVPQGDYLDFELVVENKGEVSQDVFVEYSVKSGNTTYYTASEAVYTPALTNQSFTRTAYIYSDQPLGSYILNAKVTYDSIQPPINSNVSFIVVTGKEFVYPPKPSPLPPKYVYLPTGGFAEITPPAPTAEISASIMITRYNNNISLARGFTRIESVTVRNNGKVNLVNVSLFVLGIPTSWFNITPERYSEIEQDKSSVFLIEFNIPESANMGEYKGTLVASSGVATDQKSVTINIFKSLEELIKSEIRRLKRDLQDLKVDMRVAEREGKDVSSVLIFANESENKIYDAEEDLENNKLEDAMDKVQSAIGLIKKARDLLEGLEVKKVPEVFIPLWIILIIIIIIAVIVFVLVYLWKKKKIKKLRSYIIPLSRIVERIKRKKVVDKDKLEMEREKIERMLGILKKEKSEGMIGVKTYEKMKKSLEKRLEKIDKKLQ